LPRDLFLRMGGNVARWQVTIFVAIASLLAWPAAAQVPPGDAEMAAYRGLHAAAAKGDTAEIMRLAAAGADLEARDGHGRTALHVAAHGSHHAAVEALIARGANPRALDSRRYDIVTIAAVKDDVKMVELALARGASAREITSPYDGTALIAAAHLGHDGVVRTLIGAGAPVDHVNNLGWTALIEAVILGDGGRRHTACVEALVAAGASLTLADRDGLTPLALARRRGFAAMVAILERAERGGR
jgi:ankyrin repeat protein